MTQEEPNDPFSGYDVLPGLEHLGRAITDVNGVPSSSPANYENLRGKPSGSILTDEDLVRIMQDLRTEFGA